MSPVRIREEADGRLARLVLDAPPDNALTLALLQELDGALAALERWPALVAVVLEGAGRDFCTGLSPFELRPPFASLVLAAWHGCLRRLSALDAVRVAKVRGRCFDAGCEATLLCHLVLVDGTAKLGFPGVRAGVVPAAGALLLAGRTGRTRAEDLLLSGGTLEAADAVSAGLATECSSGWEDLDALVSRRLQQDVLSRPAPAVRAFVRALRETDDSGFAEALAALEPRLREALEAAPGALPAASAIGASPAAPRRRPPR